MSGDVLGPRDPFPETLLLFQLDDVTLTVDLREPVSAELRKALARLGPARSFAVVTAANPMGDRRSEIENDAAFARLCSRLLDAGAVVRPVDGVSPDRSHRERGFAVWTAEPAAQALAREFSQLAYFSFDGERFWLVYSADGSRRPLPDRRENAAPSDSS